MLTLDDQIKNILPPKYPSTDQIVNDNEKRRQEGFNGAVNKALGNAIVPQVVKEIFMAIKTAEVLG